MNNTVFDGNNQTITATGGGDSKTCSVFYEVRNSTIKNLNVVVNEANLVNETQYTTTFENVNVSGSWTVGGNCGIYTTYAVAANVTFRNCVADAAMTGIGGSTDYNAVFVGYPYLKQRNPHF